MPEWIVPVRENFSVNKRFCRKQTIETNKQFLFQILHLAFTAFELACVFTTKFSSAR